MSTYIFDLDGTLIDTLNSLLMSVNKMMDRLSLNHISKTQCREYIGNGAKVLVEKSLRAVLPKLDDKLLNEAFKIYQEEFSKYCNYKVEAYDGIKELLNELKKRGHTLAVLSNKPHVQAVETTQNIFGSDIFDLIQGEIYGNPRKPDPKAMYSLASKLNIILEDCIFIGDTEVDIQTGKNVGVYTIGVTWGFRDIDVLKKENADIIVNSAFEIL